MGALCLSARSVVRRFVTDAILPADFVRPKFTDRKLDTSTSHVTCELLCICPHGKQDAACRPSSLADAMVSRYGSKHVKLPFSVFSFLESYTLVAICLKSSYPLLWGTRVLILTQVNLATDCTSWQGLLHLLGRTETIITLCQNGFQYSI